MSRTRQTVLSHDPFARCTVVRETLGGSEGDLCDWCGCPRSRAPHNLPLKLFIYFTVSDGGTTRRSKGAFCSKSCHDSYHG